MALNYSVTRQKHFWKKMVIIVMYYMNLAMDLKESSHVSNQLLRSFYTQLYTGVSLKTEDSLTKV